MKILVVCQYYSPEPFRVADICETLVKEGHKVDVITSLPNYPMGKIYDGYRDGNHKDEVVNGVKVHRVFTVGRRTGAFFRFINYYAYAVAGTLYASRLKEKYDAILVYQLSPVLMAYPAMAYKKKHSTPLLLYCLDLWPDSLTLGGLRKDSLIYKYYKKESERIYKSADKILVSSNTFKKYFSHMFDINGDEIDYLPQYAEDVFCDHKEEEKGKTVNFTFAGNVGTTQSIETILHAAKKLENEEVHFNIYGDGSGLEKLKELALELNSKNVTFHGRIPVETVSQKYAQSDALIVTLSDNPVLSMSFPGKIQAYMAAGKPIIGAVNGEAAEIIKAAQCGFCSPAEDVDGLVDSIRRFLTSDKTELGRNARKYYEDNFQKAHFIERLTKELEDLG